MTSKLKFNSLKDYIAAHLKQNLIDKNNELEIRFGTNKSYRLSKINFDNIIKMIKSFDFSSENENGLFSLKISQDKSNTRCEIFGEYYIQEYCRNNSIEEMIKLYPDNITFMSKMPVEIDGIQIPIFDNNDFKFRIAYNRELSLNYTDVDAISFISNTKTTKGLRFINRVTYTHPHIPIKIDCSITKFANVKNSNTIEQSRLFDSQEHYEVEIEINNDTFNLYTDSDLYFKIQQAIKYVLYGIHESFYPISVSTINDILTEYKNIIQTDYPIFCGPSSVTLQLEHLDPDNANNILNNYTVTDKADGIRKLLFINSKGFLYFIDQNLKIQYSGTSINYENAFNTIIDGEHILYDKNNNYINIYAAFDIYYVASKNVRDYTLIQIDDKPSRLDILTKLILNIRNHISNTNILNIITKSFNVIYDDTNIYEQCSKLFTTFENELKYNYDIDGLIFTPANLTVGASKLHDKSTPPNKNTWLRSFKWKPAQFNTIDFLVSFPNDTPTYKYINKEGSLDKYQVIHLRVGYNIKRDGFINPFKTLLDADFYSKDEADNTNYFPALFHPTNPYDNETHMCYIKLKNDANGVEQMFTNNNEIFTKKMIVEFQYNINEENFYKWSPLKVRYDKTYSLQTTGKNFGNDYKVANSNWHSIHFPITKNMLITGDISSFDTTNEIYYNNNNKSKKRTPLRNFHNFIKASLINYSASHNSADNILFDIAVGKAGDLNKWNFNKNIKFIFGIDLSRDNIENKIDGACKRYIDLKLKDTTLNPAIFLQGDATLNIRDGSAFTSSQYKSIANGIFGIGTKSKELLGNVVYNNFGIAKDGFDIISCQFALHYFFKNKSTLQNFIINIVESTKLNGLFIGTCYNGKHIFNKLYNTNQLNFSDDDGNLILTINKKYNKDQFNDDISSLGYPIEIFQDTINKSNIEYLVNFEFLIRIMENYGFKLKPLIEDDIFKYPADGFENIYKNIETNSKYKYLNLNENYKNISFLNYYFIFEKIRNVNIHDVVWDDVYDLDTTIDIDDFDIKQPKIQQQKIKLKIKSPKKD